MSDMATNTDSYISEHEQQTHVNDDSAPHTQHDNATTFEHEPNYTYPYMDTCSHQETYGNEPGLTTQNNANTYDNSWNLYSNHTYVPNHATYESGSADAGYESGYVHSSQHGEPTPHYYTSDVYNYAHNEAYPCNSESSVLMNLRVVLMNTDKAVTLHSNQIILILLMLIHTCLPMVRYLTSNCSIMRIAWKLTQTRMIPHTLQLTGSYIVPMIPHQIHTATPR